MLELWGIWSTPSLPGEIAPDRVLSLGQIELNYVLMPNWIVRNRTIFDIDIVLRLNWIVWIRTVWLNRIAWKEMFLTIKLWTHAKLNCLK